jgi:hypothetical protein
MIFAVAKGFACGDGRCVTTETGRAATGAGSDTAVEDGSNSRRDVMERSLNGRPAE